MDTTKDSGGVHHSSMPPKEDVAGLVTQEQEEDKPPCPFCQNCPCWLEQGLYDSLVVLEQSIRDGDHDNKVTNKEVRYQLYRHATAYIHGFLGKGNRIKLPRCVETDIRDLAPEPAQAYEGFREAEGGETN
jgi:hypothetical protein